MAERESLRAAKEASLPDTQEALYSVSEGEAAAVGGSALSPKLEPGSEDTVRPSLSVASQVTDSSCLISLDDAKQLFDFFFTRLNVRWSLLQVDLHTPEFCSARSPFLYNTGEFRIYRLKE